MNQALIIHLRKNIAKLLNNQKFSFKRNKDEGHDHYSFLINDNYILKIAKDQEHSKQVNRERLFLNRIAKQVNFAIPKIIFAGFKNSIIPFDYNIYSFIKGNNLNQAKNVDAKKIALELANCLKQLQLIKINELLPPNQENFWRGQSISIYQEDFNRSLKKISAKKIYDQKNLSQITNLWSAIINTPKNKKAAFLNGDIDPNNIIVKNQKIVGLIDFGLSAIGDPACDYAIAWTYFNQKSRAIFFKKLAIEMDEQLRSAGWALWKSIVNLANSDNPIVIENSGKAIAIIIEWAKQKSII